MWNSLYRQGYHFKIWKVVFICGENFMNAINIVWSYSYPQFLPKTLISTPSPLMSLYEIQSSNMSCPCVHGWGNILKSMANLAACALLRYTALLLFQPSVINGFSVRNGSSSALPTSLLEHWVAWISFLKLENNFIAFLKKKVFSCIYTNMDIKTSYWVQFSLCVYKAISLGVGKGHGGGVETVAGRSWRP